MAWIFADKKTQFNKISSDLTGCYNSNEFSISTVLTNEILIVSK